MADSLHAERLACTPDRHLLTTHNPWTDTTWCRCGQHVIPGSHRVHRERYVHDHPGQGARILGYERYTLGRCGCHPDGLVTT